MSIKFHIPALGWALIILAIIAVPGNYIPQPHGVWELLSPDKIIHLGMFAPLTYLIMRGMYKAGRQYKMSMIIAFLFGIVYAFSTELLQYYVIQGRNGNIYDALADIIGAGLGLALFKLIHNY